MANVYATNTNKVVNTPSDLPDAPDVGGNVQVFSDDYEASGLASGQTIGVAFLPKGAKVKDVIVDHDALGASTTLAVGDAGAAGRYHAASSTTSAGTIALDAIGGRNYAVTDNDGSGNDTREIVLTVGGAAVTGTIKTTVLWTFY